jgi:dTMP kinase
VIEGADASGKTTLAKRLVQTYKQRGLPVVTVREPGGTQVSERIRRILLDPKSEITPASELFLYLAARAQLVEDVIGPALERGDLVIADRFSLSTIAYQVGGRGLPLRAVREADRLARAGADPDLTIVLTVTARQQAARRKQEERHGDRMESQSAKFFKAVREAYAHYGRGRGVVTIDSSIGAENVYQESCGVIERRLAR